MSDFEHSGVKISEQRQQTIIDEWNNRPSSPPSLKEMVQLAFLMLKKSIKMEEANTENA